MSFANRQFKERAIVTRVEVCTRVKIVLSYGIWQRVQTPPALRSSYVRKVQGKSHKSSTTYVGYIHGGPTEIRIATIWNLIGRSMATLPPE
jgi:hypothetical protein